MKRGPRGAYRKVKSKTKNEKIAHLLRTTDMAVLEIATRMDVEEHVVTRVNRMYGNIRPDNWSRGYLF